MKKFLIMGSINAYAWKEIFPLVKFNKIDIGYFFCKGMKFTNPYSNEYKKLCNVGWYQSLKKNIDRKEIEFTKQYNPVDYPKYDNYDAINVDRYKDIPVDYEGEIGVPISFAKFMNRQKFELVCVIAPILNGKQIYARLIIKNNHPVSTENTVNNSTDE